jgi:predicted ester cyclase
MVAGYADLGCAGDHNGGDALGWLSRTPGHVGGSAARARSGSQSCCWRPPAQPLMGTAPAAGAVAAAPDLGQDWQDSCRGITIDLAQPGREWLFSCPQVFPIKVRHQRLFIKSRDLLYQIVGMTGKEGQMGTERQVMQDYVDALIKRADFSRYFANDVVATMEGTDQRAEGREAAEQMIRYIHQQAFDARPELKNLLVDENKAALEADFVGTHTGEFAGVQPTGRAVRVPYSVVYDLHNSQISKLRIYFPIGPLVEQITS